MRAAWMRRLLPTLLPCPWSTIDAGRHAWNIDPADSHPWTVLDGLPMPTDQKVGGSSPSERASESEISIMVMTYLLRHLA